MVPLPEAAGRAVAVPMAALARLRRGKPMHPRGVVFSAVLVRHGADTGAGWLDRPGTDDVVVRLSRGAGLPPPLPDLLGLAVRAPGPVDLLMSSSGTGRWTRRLPVPRRAATAPYGSIMSYRSGAGPVWLSALPQGAGLPLDRRRLPAEGPGTAFALSAAVGAGEWQRFATLTLREAADPADPPVHFDAVLHAPPGLAADGPVARFREPSYARSRAAQGSAPGAAAR